MRIMIVTYMGEFERKSFCYKSWNHTIRTVADFLSYIVAHTKKAFVFSGPLESMQQFIPEAFDVNHMSVKSKTAAYFYG